MRDKIKNVKEFFNREKCSCNKIATYYYAPSYEGKKEEQNYYCEDCVPRGCGCNYHHSKPEDFHPPLDEGEKPEGIEGKDWKWVEIPEREGVAATTKEDGLFVYLDVKGREYPCCEFMWSEDGWEKDEE